jgi:hypothetical protein
MAKTVRITEPTWRKIDRLLKDEQASRTVLPLTGAGTNIIRVRNNTADIINRFGALGVSGSVIEMAVENPSHNIIVDGYTPSAIDHANGKFVICAEPIQSGRIGRAYAAGVTAAIVNVVDESHTYADIDDGQYCLKSAESGTCAILWKESGTGQLLAIVRFGGAGSVGTSIRKAYCLTAGGVGNTINCTLDHITGEVVVVFCSIIGAVNLVDCFPTLSVGTMMPVWYDNRDYKWRSLWWFQAHEPCPEVPV